MKVLFNATTLVMGGALQVAVSFIKQSFVDNEVQWYYALSKEVYNELSDNEQSLLMSRCSVFDISPSRSEASRNLLISLEDKYSVDIVFTLFGPAYTKFNKPHVCGVADGWVTHSSLQAFKSLDSLSAVFKMFATMTYKAIWYRKSNAWIVEADNAKSGLIKRLFLHSSKIHVVKNTCGQQFFDMQMSPPKLSELKKIRILCMSAYYPHKNLEIIPEVLNHLNADLAHIEFEFVITLPLDSPGYIKLIEAAKKLGVEHNICNLGHVKVYDAPSIYEQCHVVFLPSLLETFSANYPEAMATKRPIVTTDLSHAHSACDDAALYFEPTNAKSAAAKIIELINDPMLLMRIVQRGEEVLKSLPTPQERFSQYVKILKSVN
ncbi:MAG: glycosyltransferase [Methylococcales bacterium]